MKLLRSIFLGFVAAWVLLLLDVSHGDAKGSTEKNKGSTPWISAKKLLRGGPPQQLLVEETADHVTTGYRATISNEGNIGWINGFPGSGGIGSGFQFNPVSSSGNRLFEGALLVGIDSTHVSDAARDEGQIFDADFVDASDIDTTIVGTTTTYTTSYTDASAELPIGVSIAQTSHSFNVAGMNNILIVQLDITNTSGGTLTGLVVGGYFDWDVNPTTALDRGAVIVDTTNTIVGANDDDPFPFDLLELHQGVSPTAYMGSVPLNENRFFGRRIAIQPTEIYPPHMTDGDKWRYMTTLRTGNENGDGGSNMDHAHFWGLGPYTLAPAATKRVGFALVAGTTLQACIDMAQEAQRIWVQDLANTINIRLTCDPFTSLLTRCVAGGTVQARATMLNSTVHAGKIVTFGIDEDIYTATIMTNGTHSRAQVSAAGYASGPHTVSLLDPAGCFTPVVVTCASSEQSNAAWEADDALWSATTQEEMTQELPRTTKLMGNYPNPFNPSTTISYLLAEDSWVTLKIYSMLGQEVATLVNEFQPGGLKSVSWGGRNDNGASVSSGIYVYRLKAGNTVQTQKMLFMK